MKAEQHALVGNRWMLAGGLLYLLEFVAIVGAGMDEILVAGASADEVVAAYAAGSVDAAAFLGGWMSLVLLGRVLVFVGLRSALAASGRSHPLMDFAVVAAAVSVTLEVVAHGLGIAAADFADAEQNAAAVLLDQGGAWTGSLVMGGLSLALLASVWCMWGSRMFSKPLVIVGLVAGIGGVLAQLTIAPSTSDISEWLTLSAVLFWVWMLWAGVVLWRRTPARSRESHQVVAG